MALADADCSDNAVREGADESLGIGNEYESTKRSIAVSAAVIGKCEFDAVC